MLLNYEKKDDNESVNKELKEIKEEPELKEIILSSSNKEQFENEEDNQEETQEETEQKLSKLTQE